MFWLLIILALCALCYWKVRHLHSYWKRKGVLQSNPVFLLGDSGPMVLRKYSAPEFSELLYSANPNSRYYGIYQFLKPALVLRDPELVKQITVKDFDHFTDRRPFTTEEADPFFAKNLFTRQGVKWREMRSTLTPTFTSNKMKYMFSLMSETGEQFVNHLRQQQDDVIEVEMREIITKFANDIIANIIFGYQCDSVKEPNNEFYMMGKELTNFFSLRIFLVFFGNVLAPKLFPLLKIPFFPPKVYRFFMKVVNENIESREKQGIVRPDMINLMMKAKNNSLEDDETEVLPDTGFATATESDIGKKDKFEKAKITNEDIAAQAILFFFAGFDSVSSLICYMAHELGVNQDAQEKLRQEVDETREKCNGKITYEALMHMKYMDMVVSETLRKWPNGIATERLCTKPYTIEPKLPGETPVHLEKGDLLVIPMYGFHRDPQYYPEPDRFIPERFSAENKSKIVPYTFMPFGTGPRSCIGLRFALLETKLLFYYLMSSFEFVPVEKTQIPIRFNRKAVNMTPEKGFWLGLKHRTET